MKNSTPRPWNLLAGTLIRGTPNGSLTKFTIATVPEASQFPDHLDMFNETRANAELIVKAVNDYDALTANADAVIVANNRLLEAQRKGDEMAMAHARIALYGAIDRLSDVRNGGVK